MTGGSIKPNLLPELAPEDAWVRSNASGVVARDEVALRVPEV